MSLEGLEEFAGDIPEFDGSIFRGGEDTVFGAHIDLGDFVSVSEVWAAEGKESVDEDMSSLLE